MQHLYHDFANIANYKKLKNQDNSKLFQLVFTKAFYLGPCNID